MFADWLRVFAGSKALRFGGMKWSVPGCELAGGCLEESMAVFVVRKSCSSTPLGERVQERLLIFYSSEERADTRSAS